MPKKEFTLREKIAPILIVMRDGGYDTVGEALDEIDELVKPVIKKAVLKGVKFGASNPYYETPEGYERIAKISESILDR